MAKGTARCNCKVCGEQFNMAKTFCKRAEADSWAEWCEAHCDVCPPCREKAEQEAIEKKNQEAAEKTSAMNLPELSGTERQVAWATTIRVRFVEEVQAIIENAKPSCRERCTMIFNHVLCLKTASSFWIENRGVTARALFVMFEKEYHEIEAQEEQRKEDEKKLEEADCVVKPEKCEKDGIAEVKITVDNVLTAAYEKDDDFIRIAKENNLKWDTPTHSWSRKLTELTGIEDRAIQLTYSLLKAGFPVAVADDRIRSKAVAGDFEKECDFWILDGGNDKLRIKWWSGDWYDTAKKITGAKWSSEKKSILVPVSSYKEIQDFAEVNGFKINKKAEKLIQDYENRLNNAETVTVADHTEQEHPDKLKEILQSSDTIPDDLIDD